MALQACLYALLGAYLGQGLSRATSGRLAVASLVVALIVSFGFVINDFADLEIDRLTKPGRPLPAGEWTRRQALWIALATALCALALATALPPVLLAIAVGNLILATAYALRLKRTVLLGNVTIALLNSSILIYGALAGGALTALVWAAATMSLLYTLAQEVLYTVDDYAGDAAAGITTTAIAFGIRPSLTLCQILMLLALLAALAPLWLVGVSPRYLLALLGCTVAPLALYVRPLVVDGSPEAIRRACAAVKLIRVSSLLPLILLRAAQEGTSLLYNR